MTTADIVIRNARIIDGTGGPSFAGDVAVSDERIVAVGPSLPQRGGREIDAGGRALAPGFIDAHTHDDRAVLTDPDHACKLSQGVTSVVVGNCGVSIAPVKITERAPPPLDIICPRPDDFRPTFRDYFAALDQDPSSVNVIAQIGHSSLRVAVMEDVTRPASADEIARMRGLTEEALADGCPGFSTGLFYPPANAAPTKEVIALAELVGAAGGFHSTHMRDESAGVLDSLDETFHIGHEGDVPVVVSHHKCSGLANHGRSTETLPKIAEAIARQPAGLDAYPYTAGSTMLARKMAKEAMRTIVAWSEPHPEVSGRDLDDIARDWGIDPLDAVDRLTPAGGIYFMMDEDDVRRILAFEHTMIGSDGLPHDVHPHPRLWGTFPRVLGHYARDVGLFSLETAVHKMTGLSAKTFRLQDRGEIRPGAFADLVMFDPETVIDLATFDEPTTPARGIDWVMVNGRMAFECGVPTGDRSGRALRRAAPHRFT
ncbi:MAG: D-aminoacylase [Pseudomonadota bacterium]